MAEYIEQEALQLERTATDEEVRAWMDGEITPIGPLVQGVYDHLAQERSVALVGNLVGIESHILQR